MAVMSALAHQAAPPPPLRRDREGAVLGGVCAGLGRRLGIDPIVLRVVFIAATAAGGLGVFAYLLAWALLPAEGEQRAGGLRVPRARRPRLVGGGGRHRAADVRGAAAVPRVGAVGRRRARVAGRARGLRRRADLAPVGQRRRPRAGARGARGAPAQGSTRSGRAALGVALVVGAALLFLYFNDALAARARRAAAGRRRARGGHADPRAVVDPARARARRRARRARPLAGARRARRAPARLRAADAGADAAPGRQPARGRRARPPPGARAARVAQRRAAVGRARRRSPRRSSSPPPRSRRRTASPVDVVAVGDRPLDDDAEALVAAAREAIVNAAKFARRRAGVGLRRGRRGRRRGVRARPRPGLRSRRGAGRPARRARVDRRPHAPPRRRRARPFRAPARAPRSS